MPLSWDQNKTFVDRWIETWMSKSIGKFKFASIIYSMRHTTLDCIRKLRIAAFGQFLVFHEEECEQRCHDRTNTPRHHDSPEHPVWKSEYIGKSLGITAVSVRNAVAERVARCASPDRECRNGFASSRFQERKFLVIRHVHDFLSIAETSHLHVVGGGEFNST